MSERNKKKSKHEGEVNQLRINRKHEKLQSIKLFQKR